MMTDFEIFTEMLTRNSIAFEVVEDGISKDVVLTTHTENVGGYGGFEATFYFLKSGNNRLERVTLYE